MLGDVDGDTTRALFGTSVENPGESEGGFA